MRIISYFLGIIFTLFAAVQFNDPDVWLWVPAYLLPAAIAFAFPHISLRKNYLVLLAIIYLIAAIALFPPSVTDWISAEEEAKSLGMKLPGIEEARESAGLFICFLAIAFFRIRSKR
ncbi:MAG: transmembrane 220 family protein [Cytophagales bacterium]|nr:transmembrane 220 family protein [Cytophagales bacterium]